MPNERAPLRFWSGRANEIYKYKFNLMLFENDVFAGPSNCTLADGWWGQSKGTWPIAPSAFPNRHRVPPRTWNPIKGPSALGCPSFRVYIISTLKFRSISMREMRKRGPDGIDVPVPRHYGTQSENIARNCNVVRKYVVVRSVEHNLPSWNRGKLIYIPIVYGIHTVESLGWAKPSWARFYPLRNILY